jgi:hypothetical protein
MLSPRAAAFALVVSLFLSRVLHAAKRRTERKTSAVATHAVAR